MTAHALSSRRLTRVRDVLQRYVDDGYGPGAIAVVARRGEVHIECVGQLSYDGAGASMPMAADTICRVASWTKPVVAACVMTLVEDGTLRLTDPIDTYVPELANCRVLVDPQGPLDDTVPAKRRPTLHDLLTCRLGTGSVLAEPGQIPIVDAVNALEHAEVAGGPAPTGDDYVRRLGELPLMNHPGERWLYYVPAIVLGVLVTRATGRSMEQLLRERIFDPLGMDDTTLEVRDEHRARLATAYTYDRATGVPTAEGTPDDVWVPRAPFKQACSALVSTPADFLAFAAALSAGGTHRGRRVLSQHSVTSMTTDHITAEQKAVSNFVWPPGFYEDFGWGYGLGITTRHKPLFPSIGSYGWYGKYGTAWFNDPREDTTTMLIRQTDSGWMPIPIFTDFWAAVYGAVDD